MAAGWAARPVFLIFHIGAVNFHPLGCRVPAFAGRRIALWTLCDQDRVKAFASRLALGGDTNA